MAAKLRYYPLLDSEGPTGYLLPHYVGGPTLSLMAAESDLWHTPGLRASHPPTTLTSVKIRRESRLRCSPEVIKFDGSLPPTQRRPSNVGPSLSYERSQVFTVMEHAQAIRHGATTIFLIQ
jgi:hypothetical protein